MNTFSRCLISNSLLLSLLFLIGCSSSPNSSQGTYSIKGKISNADKIVSAALINLNQDTPNTQATTSVKNGEFEFNYELKEPGAFVIMLSEKDSTTSAEQRLLVFVDSKAITVEGDAQNFINAKVSGSVLHPTFDALRVRLMADQEQLMALDQQLADANNANDTTKATQLSEASFKITKSQIEYIQSVVEKNKDNALGAFLACSYLVEGNAPTFNIIDNCRATVEGVQQAISAKNPDYYWAKELTKIVTSVREAEARTAIGADAPTIKAFDINNKEFDLTTLKGTPTVLIFWAARNQKSKQWAINFQDYCKKIKDLSIVMISVDYPAEEDFWRSTARAIPAKTHIFDPGAEQISSPLYNVKLIPYAILIDKNGKIKQKDIQAEQIPELIK
ncbi:MAG: DUF4369 domain-containing protein [Cytophagales bacterium]|nr:MAG: DUF4369 domain-containing protein [Cytophagales bacterium]TAF60093.1 MAG: DUF4369 domain-containing protein [Cytophagales bacterium]